jgi:dipeptidyl aminopeptidase/acylaminoacyl peptidase
MAAWLPTRTDRFRCSIVHAPVFNTMAMCSGDMTQGLEREIGGEPWSMPAARETIDRWNPAMHTAAYTTPTLVTHGAKDYRCPAENAFELYGMLKAKGVAARLAHYPDECHWIQKRRNSIHWYGEVLGWIARYVG